MFSRGRTTGKNLKQRSDLSHFWAKKYDTGTSWHFSPSRTVLARPCGSFVWGLVFGALNPGSSCRVLRLSMSPRFPPDPHFDTTDEDSRVPPSTSMLEAAPHADDLRRLAERMSWCRERRTHFLSADLFGEPAWEMLLALYRADVMGYPMTVSNLCRESSAPFTTALRWIDRLEELGLVKRVKNPFDQRVFFLQFTDETRTQMRQYLTETWTKLFPSPQ